MSGVLDVVAIPGGAAVVATNSWAAIQGAEKLRIRFKPTPHDQLDSAAISKQMRAGLGEDAQPINARADGDWVAVSTSSQSIAERVMRLVGRPDLIEQPWFASGHQRAEHADELDDAVSSWIGARRTSEVIAASSRRSGTTARHPGSPPWMCRRRSARRTAPRTRRRRRRTANRACRSSR